MNGARMVAVLAVLAAIGHAACKPRSPGNEPDAAESPQAQAVPAPVTSASAVASGGSMPRAFDGGPPPVPLRGDVGLEADLTARDPSGYVLTAVFRHADTPAPIRAPELAAAAVENLRKRLESRVEIDLTPARMRLLLASPAFVPSEGTELRSRLDRYGHLVLLPGSSHYRVASPGGLRSFFQEGRLDISPLSPAAIDEHGESRKEAALDASTNANANANDGPKRLGLRLRKVSVTTRAGTVDFELARLPDLGDGGLLLCRTLLELVAASEETPACGPEELPVFATYRWKTKGSLSFEVTSIVKRPDIPAAHLSVPPAQAIFDTGPLPLPRSSHIATDQELKEMRTAAVDVPGAVPSPGLTLLNVADVHRFVFVDHVPVAWLAPGARETIRGLVRGRYQLQWRTFLGDDTDPVVTTTVPGIVPEDAGL